MKFPLLCFAFFLFCSQIVSAADWPPPSWSDEAISYYLPTQPVEQVANIEKDLSKSVPQKGNKRGFVRNYFGKDCWYTQQATNTVYFHEFLKSRITLMVFDDPKCMIATDGYELSSNQKMINNLISRWYTISPGHFKTDPVELGRQQGMLKQSRGYCMQSTKHPQSIWIDYFGEGYNISHVAHDGPSYSKRARISKKPIDCVPKDFRTR